jgi:RNA-directed DNA polymerase
MTPEEYKKCWQDIENAGGPTAYIDRELRSSGAYRYQRKTAKECFKIFKNKPKDQPKAYINYITAARAEQKERSRIRKFVWEVYTATHINHLGNDIFWSDFFEDDFFDPFERHKRIEEQGLPTIETLDEVISFFQNVVPELTVPYLRWYCYHRETAETIHYRQFSIPKRSGGYRDIWAPLPNLKAMQKYILTDILEKMSIHGSAHGFVPGKSIYSNAEAHTNSEVVVSLDLENFFPTFTFPRVKGIFRSYGYNQAVSTLLALICTESPRKVIQLKNGLLSLLKTTSNEDVLDQPVDSEKQVGKEQVGEEQDGKTLYVATGPRCLPQGSPASPALTNIACMRLDRRLSKYALNNGWRYTRYADDLTFSLPKSELEKDIISSKVGKLLSMVRHVVTSEGLKIHPKKTHIMYRGMRQIVTGLITNDTETPRVPRERRKMLRAALHNAQKGKEVEHALAIEQLMGHASFVYLAQPELGRNLINAFSELLSNENEDT